MKDLVNYVLVGISAEFTMTETSNRVMVDLIEKYDPRCWWLMTAKGYKVLFESDGADRGKAMRFMEEVENLIQLFELRIGASYAGFPKVSLTDQNVTVTLPPETDEKFYGKHGDTDSPFQRIISKIGSGEINNVFLKQKGKELTLQFTQLPDSKIKEYLMHAKSKIEEIASYLSSG